MPGERSHHWIVVRPSRIPAETLAWAATVYGDHRRVSDLTVPRGEATNPLSWEALEAKFSAATRVVVTDAQRRFLASQRARVLARRIDPRYRGFRVDMDGNIWT